MQHLKMTPVILAIIWCLFYDAVILLLILDKLVFACFRVIRKILIYCFSGLLGARSICRISFKLYFLSELGMVCRLKYPLVKENLFFW